MDFDLRDVEDPVVKFHLPAESSGLVDVTERDHLISVAAEAQPLVLAELHVFENLVDERHDAAPSDRFQSQEAESDLEIFGMFWLCRCGIIGPWGL